MPGKAMKNADKLKGAMLPGRVYRRQDLTGASTAVDRDLKTLLGKGEIRKLHGGLYSRPRENPFGFTPPSDHELVRAFLKTGDFLLTSRNHYNQLGLGLTQVYHDSVVYNHKRAGDYILGGKRFRFRRVPAFPRRMTREYLLVDLLNNLESLPDDTGLVRRNLGSRMDDFDRQAVRDCLQKYGRPAARRLLQDAL
jgi:hypothetical protein